MNGAMLGGTGHPIKCYSLSLGQKVVRLRAMESALDYHTARALLEWQIELGATEAIGDAPVDRYALPDTAPKAKKTKAAQAAPEKPKQVDPVAVAKAAAASAGSLDQLRSTMEAFEHCDLKRGARQLVFADGTPGARVMIVGEAPGRRGRFL